MTGIDFAGRIHDVDDIRTYVWNWKEIYEFDSQNKSAICLSRGRDFYVKENAPQGEA